MRIIFHPARTHRTCHARCFFRLHHDLRRADQRCRGRLADTENARQIAANLYPVFGCVDPANYARCAHIMRIIDLIGAYIATAMRKERRCSPCWRSERDPERCCCGRWQAAQAWASLRKFRPGRSVHVGRLTSLPSHRLTATRRGARVVRRTRAPLRTFLPKSACADFQESPASRG